MNNYVLYKFSKNIEQMNAEDLKLYSRDYYFRHNKNYCELFGMPTDEECLKYLELDLKLAESSITNGMAEYNFKTGEVENLYE